MIIEKINNLWTFGGLLNFKKETPGLRLKNTNEKMKLLELHLPPELLSTMVSDNNVVSLIPVLI